MTNENSVENHNETLWRKGDLVPKQPTAHWYRQNIINVKLIAKEKNLKSKIRKMGGLNAYRHQGRSKNICSCMVSMDILYDI